MRYKAAGSGVLITTILLLLPLPYTYAPVLGGLSTAVIIHMRALDGFKSAALVVLGMIPAGIGIVILLETTPSAISNSGAVDLRYALRGSGPQNVIFDSVFIYIVAIYTGICTTLFTIIGSAVSRFEVINPI